MIRKIILVLSCFLIVGVAEAKGCNRTHPDDGDYLQPYEFCDDDFGKKNLPKFENSPAIPVGNLTPIFPKEIPGADGDKEWVNAWNEAIVATYKGEGVNFAGHYLLVQRDCGADCRLTLIVDLLTGIAYRPIDAASILNTVNPLSANLIKKLGLGHDYVSSYRPDSKLLVVIGSLGETTKKQGVYYFKWENNRLKLIDKIEKKRPY